VNQGLDETQGDECPLPNAKLFFYLFILY